MCKREKEKKEKSGERENWLGIVKSVVPMFLKILTIASLSNVV